MKRFFLLFLICGLLSGCGKAPQPVQTQPPTTESKQYITVNNKEKELVGTRKLTTHYTRDTLVQFKDFYDFGLRDQRPLGFSGKIYLNGVELSSSEYRFDGYPDKTIIVLNLFMGKQLKDNVLTVEEGAVIFYDDEAVVIPETFCGVWDGEKWTNPEYDQF